MHVVILPWSAFGHLIPFLHLSIALAKAGIRVFFVSSTANLRRLPLHFIPPDLAAPLDLVELHLPAVDGLPADAEATVDIAMDQIQYLKIAYDLLKPQLKQFISHDTPDWIIQDFAPHWTAEISRELDLHVPLIMFSVFYTTLFAFFGPPEYLTGEAQTKHWPSPESLTSPPEWIDFPSTVAFRPFESIPMYAGVFGKNASGTIDAERLMLTVTACEAVVARSCKEYEGQYFELLEKVLGEEPDENYFSPLCFLSMHFNALLDLLRALYIGIQHGKDFTESLPSILLEYLGSLFLGLVPTVQGTVSMLLGLGDNSNDGERRRGIRSLI